MRMRMRKSVSSYLADSKCAAFGISTCRLVYTRNHVGYFGSCFERNLLIRYVPRVKMPFTATPFAPETFGQFLELLSSPYYFKHWTSNQNFATLIVNFQGSRLFAAFLNSTCSTHLPSRAVRTFDSVFDRYQLRDNAFEFVFIINNCYLY